VIHAQAIKGLPASVLTRIEGICSKAGTSNVAELRKAATQVCAELSTQVAAAARPRLLAACRGK
jgi:hypothetical protein